MDIKTTAMIGTTFSGGIMNVQAGGGALAGFLQISSYWTLILVAIRGNGENRDGK